MARVGDLELIDCGDGRRLERFGDVVVDRPAPGRRDATPARPRPTGGARTCAGPAAPGRRAAGDPAGRSTRRRPPARVPARGRRPGRAVPGARGDLGWLDGAVRAAAAAPRAPARAAVPVRLHRRRDARLRARRRAGRPRRRLEARGRLGAAERGAVGARRPARPLARRRRARRSSAASGAAAARYDGVVLDPPSYGHGSAPWQIETDLAAAARRPRGAPRPAAGRSSS